MAVYVIVLVVVVLLLVAAYRSLGGAASAAVDTPSLLRQLLEQVRTAIAGLPAGADAAPSASRDGAAQGAGRAAAAAQHSLDSLPSVAQLSEQDSAARALLAAAVEDAAWAARIVRAGSTSPGLGAAAALLRDHATNCCDAAEDLLGSATLVAGREPRDGG